jgi:ketosteroid isomerase-like protein
MSAENVGVEALRDNGAIVVALIRFQAVGWGGVRVDQQDVHVLTFRGSRVTRLEAFPDPKEALEAAGVEWLTAHPR